MTDFMTPQTSPRTRPVVVRDREGTEMLLHEALARSRHARGRTRPPGEHALVRRLTAGRRWASLAGFAARRAERARVAAHTEVRAA